MWMMWRVWPSLSASLCSTGTSVLTDTGSSGMVSFYSAWVLWPTAATAATAVVTMEVFFPVVSVFVLVNCWFRFLFLLLSVKGGGLSVTWFLFCLWIYVRGSLLKLV